MILFLNVFITDQGFAKYDRGLLPSSNRVDIFKYSLASLSVIKWTKVIIYYDMDTNYQDRRDEVDSYIKSLFCDPIIYPFRNDRQTQWKVAMQELFDMEDDLVWFCCNDDHIFIDYETDLLERIEAKLAHLAKSHKYVSCFFSHWPEALFYGRTPPRYTKVGVVEEHKDYFITIWQNCDSIQIVNKNLLHYWWFEQDYGDAWMPRTDSRNVAVVSPDTACIIPYRELVRHFDGYSHNKIDINTCPPLFIPDGFFENDVKILYCSDTKKEGYVHVNPLKKNYSTVDREGADLKCVLEDIPLFWRSRIVEMETAKHEIREVLLKCRNDSILEISRQKILLPVTKLKCALRFDDSKIPLEEMRLLELNFIEKMYKKLYFKWKSSRLNEIIPKN